MSAFDYLKTSWRLHRATDAVSQLRGVWVADEQYVRDLFETMRAGAASVSAADIRDARRRSEERAKEAPELVIEQGVARIPIAGPIMRETPCIFELFGIAATSTRRTQQLLRDALASDEVKSILLEVDSPGGTLDGTGVLADELFAARSVKPVNAHATGMAASAGYWIPVQATRFTSEGTSMIGSIGVYAVIEDLSARAAMDGVKVHVVRSGPHKGAGVEGSEVTPAMLAVEQEIIDRARGMFIDAIARGRGNKLSRAQVEQLATGRCWLGADAASLNLIDGIETIEAAFSVAAATTQRQTTRALISAGGAMSNTPNTPATAPQPNAGDELELLRAELAASKAANATLSTELQKTAGERDLAMQVLEDHRWQALDRVISARLKAGHFNPSSRPTIENIARKTYLSEPDGAAQLDAYLAEMPLVVKPKAKVAADELPPEPDADAQAAITDAAIRAKLDADLSKALNISVARAQQLRKVAAVRADGKAIDADGNIIDIPAA